MSESSEARQEQTPEAPEKPRGSFVRRVVAALVIAGAALAGYFAGAALLPRWWSHRIGDQVDGSISAGIGLGLFYGFVFTFLALLVLWIALRRRRSLRVYVVTLALALLLAAPNLLTLGIVLGSGNAAHAGERTLDVEAPSFRTSVLIGAIAAAVAILGIAWLVRARRRAQQREQRLRDELDAARAAHGETPAST